MAACTSSAAAVVFASRFTCHAHACMCVCVVSGCEQQARQHGCTCFDRRKLGPFQYRARLCATHTDTHTHAHSHTHTHTHSLSIPVFQSKTDAHRGRVLEERARIVNAVKRHGCSGGEGGRRGDDEKLRIKRQ